MGNSRAPKCGRSRLGRRHRPVGTTKTLRRTLLRSHVLSGRLHVLQLNYQPLHIQRRPTLSNTFGVCIHLKQFLQCDRAISTIHFENLYDIYWLFRRSSNDHNPDDFKLSSYVFSRIFIIILVYLCCIFPNKSWIPCAGQEIVCYIKVKISSYCIPPTSKYTID